MDLVVQAAQPDPEIFANLGVERTERLVEQQHLRIDGQRARQRHALPLPARQLIRVAGLESGQPDHLQQVVDLLLDLGLGLLADLQPEPDVVADRQVLERGVVLEDEADAPLLR